MGNDRLGGKQVGSQASRRVTRRLAWIQPVCISINAVPALKGFKKQDLLNMSLTSRGFLGCVEVAVRTPGKGAAVAVQLEHVTLCGDTPLRTSRNKEKIISSLDNQLCLRNQSMTQRIPQKLVRSHSQKSKSYLYCTVKPV